MENVKHTEGDACLTFDGSRFDVEIDGWIITTINPYAQNSDGQECGEANGRRIVACVNACAGIDTDQIELVNIAAMIDEVTRLRAESERLRDVLGKLIDSIRPADAHECGFSYEFKTARAALSETAQPAEQ